MDILIPTLIILVANLYSDTHTSQQFEFVTSLFGWSVIVSFSLWFVLTLFSIFHYHPHWLQHMRDPLFKIFWFSMVSVLARDYERLLKPYFDSWINKK